MPIINVDMGVGASSDGGQATNCTPSSWVVTSASPLVIVPSTANRLYFTIYHEGSDDLLLEFGSNPLTSSNYALALPASHLFHSSAWDGQVKGLSRGADITVFIREFYL